MTILWVVGQCFSNFIICAFIFVPYVNSSAIYNNIDVYLIFFQVQSLL